MNKISKIIILILIIAIVVVTSFILYLKIMQEQIYFVLNGNEEINLYEGDIYKELGFIAKDKDNNNLNNRVTIKSDLNTKIVGNYIITYSIETKLKTHTLTRKVNVLKDPLKNVEFSLKGNKIVNIILNEKYNDSLYTCINKENNQDLSNLVVVKNNVNNNQIGTYEISYTLKIDNKSKTLTRTINVLEKKYNTIISNTSPTNEDVTINFTSNIPNISYIITPDNIRINEKNINYVVKENGIYKFIVYDNENNYEEYNVEINNIDKEKPQITSCNSVISNNKTSFNITTNSTDFLKYKINEIEFTTNNYTINQTIENGTITIYDKANNTNTFKCNSYYKEISPKGNENIIANSNTDTLKVWIEKNNRQGRTSYYITHIWMKDAYNQFKIQIPNNYGKELSLAKTQLDNAISQYNMQDKLIVAVNASGFVKKGVWGDNYYNANPAWNLTGGSPLILVNGKVIRDFATANIPSMGYVTYGLKKDGNLDYYQYKKGNNSQENINLSQKIINDGVLNTFAFSPVLVLNSQKKSTDTAKNIRQGLCQIDKNNFVLVTDIFNSQRNGFSFSELADLMLSLNCKTGFNLDGGGSTSLIFKDKGNASKVITGNTRAIADILYFHE